MNEENIYTENFVIPPISGRFSSTYQPKNKGNKPGAVFLKTLLKKVLVLETDRIDPFIGKISRLPCSEHICLMLVFKALNGDLEAAKIIFDRVDGKPKMSVDIGGQEDNPVLVKAEINFNEAEESIRKEAAQRFNLNLN